MPRIDPDQPLRASDAIDHDKLHRLGFATAAVAALGRVSSTAGFVLSIEGPWGSGKTSALSMMEQLIRTEKPDESVIVHFNPWLIGERDSLLRQFLHSVSAAINLEDHADDAKRVSKELLNYAEVFDFLKWLPGAEPWASIVKNLLKSAGKATGGVADQKSRDIAAQKDKLEKVLAKFNKKIYVFVDDVDRLFPAEVFEMVRIIKAVGHLPNIGYIVAWDPEYIRLALKSAAIPHAVSYIDKIVQVRLPVPAISSSARLQLLNDGIASLPAEATTPRFRNQEERLRALYFHGLRDLLEQPRDVTRVMNTLSVIEPALRGEVVFADILGLACLMVRAPRVYDALRRNPALFTPANSSHTGDKKKNQEEHRKATELLYATTGNPKAVRELMDHLFPANAQASGRFANRSANDVEGHLAAPSRLNIALSMAIGSTDVSLVDARRYLYQPAERLGIEARITAANCLGFLELLGDLAKVVSENEILDLTELCLSIARVVDRPPMSTSSSERRFFSLPAESLAINAIRQLVASNGTRNAKEIAFAIACDPLALTVASEILWHSLATQHEEGDIVCSPSRKKAAAIKLAENATAAVEDGTLWLKCNPSRVLWTIMRVCSEASAKNLFSVAKRNDPDLDQFALHFLKHSFSSDGGQAYALPDDVAFRRMVNLRTFVAHAKRRLDNSQLDYPLRAAWRSVVEGRPLYGFNGSDARH
ncbi:P-loop NTPase fold protein [Lysobacter sp. ESA13C]|uniref:KAP family P-loop NTPase fold protein n=1 Tax=Lysobacter sp. ESA13C TaxID=2862676 RepID=UPI001CC0C049|nr:P-loop NTPase fold protein [Lysobacter sp. ESA13C]